MDLPSLAPEERQILAQGVRSCETIAGGEAPSSGHAVGLGRGSAAPEDDYGDDTR